MKTTRASILFYLTMISGVLLLASCGGGGGSGSGSAVSSVETGSVGVVLTDKPAELSDIDEILISINRVELLGGNDDNKATLYSGPARGPFDLLELEDESRLLTFADDVPSGTYCKIRLTLSNLTLVFNNGEPDFHPKLPGNNKLDLNARDCFYVAPGKSVYLQLDMDARSIHVVQTGNGKRKYNFRPVVFIDVMDADFDSKLVRLEEGVIRDIDTVNGTLLLCDFDYGDDYDERNSDDGSDDCVTIAIKDTAAFDNIDDDGINVTSGGDAIPLDELLVPERIGTYPVTVVGHMRNHDYDDHDGDDGHHDDDYDHDNDDGHHDDDYDHDGDDGHHDDDYDDGRDNDRDGDDGDGDGDHDNHADHDDDYHHHRYPRLEALVVELGSFLSLDGKVASGASDIRFNMDVAPGQEISPDDELPVKLQETTPLVNGTRIMNPLGDPLKTSDIIVPRPVLVDGVLAISSTDPDYLNSALVIVDTTGSDDADDVAEGIIAETSESGLRLKADSFPCEDMLDAIYDVDYTPSTTVWVATSRGGYWSDTDYLQPRQEVDISGTCNGTVLEADVIIVREN